MKNTINIVMLYPREMNIYGDHGNLEYLTRRAELYGLLVKQLNYNLGDNFPTEADIILGGGGQDSGQRKIVDDLLKIGPELRNFAKAGAPMLVICGFYQLFGRYFLTKEGKKIPGIGIFDAYTEAGTKRLIGNVTAEWENYELVGYENHSGLTFLDKGQQPLAQIVSGAGNNGQDGTEGACRFNAFGSYLHGPLLPKNPRFADELLRIAVRRKFGKVDLQPASAEAAAELSRLDKLASIDTRRRSPVDSSMKIDSTRRLIQDVPSDKRAAK